ncbi:TlpA disulfide reductase family protein [Neorhodopirellula pilleata]|uniref:Thiol:disulfide interchange protein TlpA n=1 Tax=Neorhodopirellula pilleata TaxID=2714738 RepID=A0A5C6AIQ3_9BACT|nr:TlpA disulfide reductase family protein [Neorhodopirellula pilleata]TWT98941.1 Thiol:disulfide interchange protein TlpA [Neorhodopirellula pilleata]
MTQRFLRVAIALVCLTATTAWNDASSAVAETTLGIGDKAPALDIEHYIHEDNGFGKVEKFEDGKVYIVEFWATWCGPCIQSMPHLVELQNKYRGEGVQIVSISDEDLETVQELMEQEYPGKEETFAEVTNAYTLTVDPDGSTTEDYMRAAGRNGIPASFLVGKTGLIEWIGHPMELDEPLADVLADRWDREAYKEQMKRQEQFQIAMQKVNQLAGSGKFEDALKVVKKVLEDMEGADDPRSNLIREQLTAFQYNLRLDSGDRSEEVMTFFRDQLAEAKKDARELTQFSYNMMASMQQGTDLGPLAGETIAALKDAVGTADEEVMPIMYVLIAQMNASMSNFDEAIANQKKAVETSTGRTKERMEQMLEQFEKMAAEEADGDQDAEGDKAAEKVDAAK